MGIDIGKNSFHVVGLDGLAFLLERGVAVRKGLRFLRTELPSILATRADVLSPRMIRKH
jgi:hypothetical protein